MLLLYWLALTLNWDLPKYGALAIALISLDTTGASLHKGIMRIVGTTFGLGVGLLGLALFAQDSSLTLVYHVLYLVVVGYFMQSSRYPYAWFVAGFLPSLVWATTYGKIDNAFSYATFRYLETTAGVVIYTAVSALIWPRNAGDALNRQGHEFCQQLQNLFGVYRRQLEEAEQSADASAQRAKLAGTATQMLSTLEAASADTPSVAAQKRVWQSFRGNARDTVESMELWRQSIDDCRHLGLDRVLPQVHSTLEKLQQRLARIDFLWQARSAGGEVNATGDHDESLLQCEDLGLVKDQAAKLSHFEKAALLSFARQLSLFDSTSCRLLRTMRVLSDTASVKDIDADASPADLYQPPRWDPARFTVGLLPAVSLIVGWFFWIYFNPPTGPSIPNMAVTFGLMAVMTPTNVLRIIPAAMVAVLAIVAPVYFLLMPRLSSGSELLALIFAFAFISRVVLVGRFTLLRTITLAAFVMMTGISNNQSYSFPAIVSGALMLLLGLVIVGIVQTLIGSMKSEQKILNSVRRFFSGCARVTSGYLLGSRADIAQGQALRKRHFETMVLPASAKVRAERKHLDYERFPDNPPEKVQQLVDALQSIINRMQALEISHQRLSTHAMQLPESFTLATKQIRVSLQHAFERWARLDSSDAMGLQQVKLRQLAGDLERQFDVLETNQGQGDRHDELLIDLYTTTGSVRGLVDAMTNTQVVINQINWQQWATPRF